jgi:ABC-2 type transport system permease protein
MNQFPVLIGALRYEFHMQVHRRTVWITMIVLGLLLAFLLTRHNGLNDVLTFLNSPSLPAAVAYWADMVNFAILPIGIGILLADRFPRDQRTKVYELFTSMPGSLSTRLLGKYLGSTLATLLPMIAFYLIGIGYILVHTHNLLAIPLALAAFATIILPGILFIAAFSIACPAIMWVPLYQFLFIGYWFWGNMLGPRIGLPTLSTTILTPRGSFIAAGLFGISPANWIQGVTPLAGVASLLLLLLISLLVMLVFYRYLRWEQSRK